LKEEITIIGAGVLGVSLAYHLSRRGQSVLVIEREQKPGLHASSKNAGMIRQLYRHPQLTNWASRSVQGWPTELRKCSFTETGSLIVGRELPSHYPSLFTQVNAKSDSGKTYPAVYTATDGLLDSNAYMHWLVEQCHKQGVRFSFGNKVHKVSCNEFNYNGDATWDIELSNNRLISTKVLVNASGAWINEILKLSCSQIAIQTQAYARHLFIVDGWKNKSMPYQNANLHYGFCWDEANDWYLRHWKSNSRLVSICDKRAADPDHFKVELDVEAQLKEKLQQQLPTQFDVLKVTKVWHCFRTYTPSQLPIWGEDPAAAGFFWLAAFGGLGMSTSFAATDDAAAYLTNGNTYISKDFCPSNARSVELKRQRAG